MATPALAAIGVAGTLSLLAGGGGGIGGRLLGVAFIVLTLGGLVVLPGTVVLVRFLRGIPDVRLDERGVVWGRDRTRDLALDWVDVEAVEIRPNRSGLGIDRVFVFTPRPGLAAPAVRSRLGRFTAAVNRMTFGSPFAVSTQFDDCPWPELRDLVVARLPDVPIVEADAAGASRRG